jgi:NAD(P)-dependent dehydrogenase (short-subunit alcohol dehydrogenase family)
MKQLNQKKVAVITGGCGLFGNLQIKALEELNYKIIVLDKNKKKIKSLKNKKEFQKTDFYYCDISKFNNILHVRKNIIKKYKTVNILVNNAANDTVPVKKKKTLKSSSLIVDIRNISSDINVGLIGAIYCSKIFGELMAKNKNGIILNISSDLSVIAPDQRLYSHLGITKPISYSVIKHGLTGLTKYLASFWAKHNVRVNSFSPGGIYNNQEKIFVRKIKKLIPMGRMAKKNEYKETIKFLCSESSSYMTGQNIVSDGGRSII